MGAPVTSGITLTKFAGVVVLAFAHTQIFKVGCVQCLVVTPTGVVMGVGWALVILGSLPTLLPSYPSFPHPLSCHSSTHTCTQVYCFRLYLTHLILGAAHSLVLLLTPSPFSVHPITL